SISRSWTGILHAPSTSASDWSRCRSGAPTGSRARRWPPSPLKPGPRPGKAASRSLQARHRRRSRRLPGRSLETPQPPAGLVVSVVVGSIADHDFGDRLAVEGRLEESVEQPNFLPGREVTVALLQFIDAAGQDHLERVHLGHERMDIADLLVAQARGQSA